MCFGACAGATFLCGGRAYALAARTAAVPSAPSANPIANNRGEKRFIEKLLSVSLADVVNRRATQMQRTATGSSTASASALANARADALPAVRTSNQASAASNVAVATAARS